MFAAELMSRFPCKSDCRGSLERGQTSNFSKKELLFSIEVSFTPAVQNEFRQIVSLRAFKIEVAFMAERCRGMVQKQRRIVACEQ